MTPTEIWLLKPVLGLPLLDHTSFEIGNTTCSFAEISDAEPRVMKALEGVGEGFWDAVGRVEGFQLSWTRNSDRYDFIGLRLTLYDQKLIEPNGSSTSHYEAPLVQAAAELHDGFAFENRFSHSRILPMSVIDTFLAEKGLKVEEVTEGVHQATLPGRGVIEYAACSSRIVARRVDDAELLEKYLGEVVEYGVSHKFGCLLFPTTLRSSPDSHRFLDVEEPKGGSASYLSWRTIQVSAKGPLGGWFNHYVLVQAVIEQFMTDLLFVRETAYSLRYWLSRESSVFDINTRKRGFVYVDITHEILAQLEAWFPSMGLQLSYLDLDLRDLTSDPYAAMYGEQSKTRKALPLLDETKELLNLLSASIDKLGERVNRRWEEMNTQIVIRKSNADLLADLQKLNDSFSTFSQDVINIGEQQTRELVALLGKVRDTLRTANHPQAKEAQTWFDKLSTGIGIAANVVAVFGFLTGVASIPAIAPLLPSIWGNLSGLYRRIVVRK